MELWHFGPGNSPGDTVVHVPEARAAWTGNLLSNERALTMLLEVPPGPAFRIMPLVLDFTTSTSWSPTACSSGPRPSRRFTRWVAGGHPPRDGHDAAKVTMTEVGALVIVALFSESTRSCW